MLGDASDRGARVVQEMLFFLTGALQTSAVAFFWIDWADGHPVADDSPATAFLAPNLLAHYKESAAEIDPLNLSLLVSRNQKVGSLAKRRSDSPDRTSVERYEGFLRFHGYEDEIDLVMWDGDLPVAAIALFKKGRAGFESSVQWPAVQRFMQHHLKPDVTLPRLQRCPAARAAQPAPQAFQMNQFRRLLRGVPALQQFTLHKRFEHAQAALLRVDQTVKLLLTNLITAAAGKQLNTHQPLLPRQLRALHQMQQGHQQPGDGRQQRRIGQLADQLQQPADQTAVGRHHQ